MNRKTIAMLPGTQIASLSPVYSNQIVVCTVTGGGFVKDTTYIRNTDNTTWIGISGGKHLHNEDTESAGGLLSDIMKANAGKLFYLHNNINIAKGSFMSEGTATIADEPGASLGSRISITTSASAGNYGHLSLGGVKLSLGTQSVFQFKGNVNNYSGNGNLTCYIGVGVASVNETHTNPQYGLQVCDSSTTERTWEQVNKNGSTSGVQTSAENVKRADGNPRSYAIVYNPGTNSKFYVNGTISTTNTSSMLAGTSSTNGIRNISMGIRTNTSTARILYIYGVSLIGTIQDSQWVTPSLST
jgi:hypothetical protein